MEEEVNFLQNLASKRILIAPLDWGLGHFTRCIPLIRKLSLQNNKIFIAAEGQGAALMQREFPDAEFVVLPSYNIKYNRKGNAFMFTMMVQLPKIAAAVKRERREMEVLQQQYGFDVIISDNRLGLSIPGPLSVYMTHQLCIKTGNLITDQIVNRIHYGFINRYDECWVPDRKGADNLAGALSHPVKMPDIPVKYIGCLSRFHKKNPEKKYRFVIVLSGPEPQRTVFEQILTNQLKHVPFPVALVRGLPIGSKFEHELPSGSVVHNHLDAATLGDLMQTADWVIARSGYSTIMDLVAIGQQAVLVPTPGQTEQEYLAKYLSNNSMFMMKKQDSFCFDDLIKELDMSIE